MVAEKGCLAEFVRCRHCPAFVVATRSTSAVVGESLLEITCPACEHTFRVSYSDLALRALPDSIVRRGYFYPQELD